MSFTGSQYRGTKLFHHFPKYVNPGHLNHFHNEDAACKLRRSITNELFCKNKKNLVIRSGMTHMTANQILQVSEELLERGFVVTLDVLVLSDNKVVNCIHPGSFDPLNHSFPVAMNISYQHFE